MISIPCARIVGVSSADDETAGLEACQDAGDDTALDGHVIGEVRRCDGKQQVLADDGEDLDLTVGDSSIGVAELRIERTCEESTRTSSWASSTRAFDS